MIEWGLIGGRFIALTSCLMLALAPVSVSAQVHPHLDGVAKRDRTALREAMLAAHNQERKARGVPPLEWNEALAADATQSAKRLAAERDPIAAHGKHAGGSAYGENLWTGTRGAYAYAEMAANWLEERSLYLDAPVPHISRTGNWAEVGHYSQMIWSATRQMGCAVVANAEMDLLVCRYDPAGNVLGHRATAALAAR